MSGVLLDASAVLALVHAERGGSAVQSVLGEACLSTVNLAEVATKLYQRGVETDGIQELIRRFGFRILPFDTDAAIGAGKLREATRHLGLSLGDRACLSTAMQNQLRILTADGNWLALAGPLGLDIESIR
jgi:ribonuclease VapC